MKIASRNSFIAYLYMVYSLLSCTGIPADHRKQSFNLPFPIDTKLEMEEVITFKMSIDGDSLGYSKLEFIKASDENWILRETAKVRTPLLFVETLETHFDPSTQRATRIILKAQIDTSKMSAELKFLPNEIHGSSSRMAKDTIISLPDNQYPLDRLMSLFYYPRIIDLESLATDSVQFKYDIIDAISFGIKEIDLKILTQPSTDQYLFQFRGGMASQNMRLLTEPVREITKITFDDQPWVYELIQ